MTASTSKCRGFTHPFMLLIRSSINPTTQRPFFTASRSRCLPSPSTRLLTRPFTTGKLLFAQIKAKSSPQTLKKTGKVLSKEPHLAASSSYAHQLAQNKHGTVLYEGGPEKMFLFSSYIAGFVCLGAGALDLHFNVFNVPPGVPAWTAYAFGVVGLVFAVLGTRFALMPAQVIRSIKVLPIDSTTTSKPTSYGPRKVYVEILARGTLPIPGLSLKRLVVEPQDLTMAYRMYNPPPQPTTELEQYRMRQQWAERKKAQKEYDDNHRMTIPFRDAKWALSSIVSGIRLSSMRKGLTGEGFAPFEVQGAKYKIDVTKGYVLDEGRALDRVVRIKPELKRTPLLSRS